MVLTLENSDLMLDGIIGGVVLRQFTLTVDWPHQQFVLEKNRLYGQKPFFIRPGFTLTTTPEGFNIAVVIPNSPATEAGLRVGDRLVEIAGQPARTLTLLKLHNLTRGEPGTKLPLTVERDGKRLSVVLTLRDLL